MAGVAPALNAQTKLAMGTTRRIFRCGCVMVDSFSDVIRMPTLGFSIQVIGHHGLKVITRSIAGAHVPMS